MFNWPYWHRHYLAHKPLPDYSLEVTEAPEEEPVDDDTFAAHARVNTDDEASMYGDWITAATQEWEETTGYTPISTSYRQSADRFDQPIVLQRGKTTEVTLVKYVDADGVEQTVTDYRSDLTGTTGVVWMDTYPVTHTSIKPVVWVEFTAGNEDAEACPKDVKVAIRQLAALMHNNRESHGDTNWIALPSYRACVDRYRVGGAW